MRQGHGSAAVKAAEPSADTLNLFDADSRRQAVNKQSNIPTVAYPEDLGVQRLQATRSLLAARSMEDLVAWSGGLYKPPAKFRSW